MIILLIHLFLVVFCGDKQEKSTEKSGFDSEPGAKMQSHLAAAFTQLHTPSINNVFGPVTN